MAIIEVPVQPPLSTYVCLQGTFSIDVVCNHFALSIVAQTSKELFRNMPLQREIHNSSVHVNAGGSRQLQDGTSGRVPRSSIIRRSELNKDKWGTLRECGELPLLSRWEFE